MDKENPGLDLERYNLAMQLATRGKLFSIFLWQKTFLFFCAAKLFLFYFGVFRLV